jgi:hypothetical protein
LQPYNLFIPHLIDQNDTGEYECNGIGDGYLQTAAHDAVDKPQERPNGKKGVHTKGNARRILCLDSFNSLGQKGNSGTKCSQVPDYGGRGHKFQFKSI